MTKKNDKPACTAEPGQKAEEKHRVKLRTLQVEHLANEQQLILHTMPIGAGFLKDRKVQAANRSLTLLIVFSKKPCRGISDAYNS